MSFLIKKCEKCGVKDNVKNMEECGIFELKEFIWKFIKKIYLCQNCQSQYGNLKTKNSNQ